MLDHYAVMGNPIAHSLSPVIHQWFARQTGIAMQYDKISVEPEQFRQQVEFFFHHGGQGLNITLPFKEKAFAMAVVPTLRCQMAKAANTLWMKKGILHADNTDGIGFIRDVSRHTELAGKTVLLLGAGGAARGVIAPLLAANITSLTVTNRTFSRAEELKEEFQQISCLPAEGLDVGYEIIVHATSAGTRGESMVWPQRILKTTSLCYDLAYCLNEKTPFVEWAEQQGCQAVDGLGMLVEQAAEAFHVWHGIKPETTDILQTLRQKK